MRSRARANSADVPTKVSEGEIASEVLDNLELEVLVVDARGSIPFCNATARLLTGCFNGLGVAGIG